MNSFIKLLYSLLIAVAVGLFVGFSVASVYQPPERPDYRHMSYDETDTAEQRKRRQEEFEKKQDDYEAAEKDYRRNVTYMLLPVSALFVVAGLWLMRKKSEVIGEGLALGGIATSIYALITSSIAGHRSLRLASVTLLLISCLVVAHQRFLTSEPTTKKR